MAVAARRATLADLQVDVERHASRRRRFSDDRRLRTAFREIRMRDLAAQVNGERMFPMGSNHGPTRMALAEATARRAGRDVQLAVDANLDLLRIHAHVTRLELYDAADAAGLLLWQDLPLQWGYARGTRKEAVRQARRMVDLLGHHPSIALWCAHNEPLAIDVQPGEGDPQAAAMALQTRGVDVPAVVEQGRARPFDHARAAQGRPTRPVNPHSGVLPRRGSGGTDTHFYFGWYHGRMDGTSPAAARDAAPGPLRHRVRRAGRARHRGLHGAAALARPRLGRPLRAPRAAEAVLRPPRPARADFDSFDAWRDATQHYQAALIQLQIEDLRRLKHHPTGGFCHFCFADGHPAVTWSVLDHARGPKPDTGRCATRAAPCSRPSSRNARARDRGQSPRGERAPHPPAQRHDRGRRGRGERAGAGSATSPPTASSTSASWTCPPTAPPSAHARASERPGE